MPTARRTSRPLKTPSLAPNAWRLRPFRGPRDRDNAPQGRTRRLFAGVCRGGQGDGGMRKWLHAAAVLSAILAHGPAFGAAPGGANYRLDIGDELRVRVFEWRSATGDVHEWAALNGNYVLSADGAISMPLLGALKASGLTIEQLADAISNQLQSRLGLTIRPQ